MKQVKKLFFGLFVTSGVLLVQSTIMSPAEAEIYKCTNKKGAIYYNDKPCPVEDAEKKIKNEKDVVDGYVPSAPVTNKSIDQGKGISVGGETSGSGGNEPERDTEKDNQQDSDKPSSAVSGGSGGESTGNSSSVKGFKEDIAQGGYDASHDLEINIDPPKERKKSNPEGKLTLQDKKLMLDIHPEDQ